MIGPFPYLLQGKNIIIVIDNKSHTISKETHISYNEIVQSIKDGDWERVAELVDPVSVMEDYSKGFVSIKDGKIYWDGEELHGALASRVVEMYVQGFPIEPMVNFIINLMDNPSKRAVDQLYSFLEKNSLPITEDGYFLAFKKVSKTYMDIHSGTISNRVGEFVEMERNKVDDNPNNTCSQGLHFCSQSYLEHFGSKDDPVMILKIDPADVVSIPTDYNGAKGRCCAYEVVAELNGDPNTAFASVVENRYTKTLPVEEDDIDSESFDDDDTRDSTDIDLDITEDDLYDLVRVNGGLVEYEGLTLEEAHAQVEKNIRQKKAKLKIVYAGTDEEVE